MGDDANQLIVFINERQTAGIILAHDRCRFFKQCLFIDRQNISNHDVGDRQLVEQIVELKDRQCR